MRRAGNANQRVGPDALDARSMMSLSAQIDCE